MGHTQKEGSWVADGLYMKKKNDIMAWVYI